jgi:hypothetical protein
MELAILLPTFPKNAFSNTLGKNPAMACGLAGCPNAILLAIGCTNKQ